MKHSTIICAVLFGAVFALAGWIVRDIVGEHRLDAGRPQSATAGIPAITLITGDAGSAVVPDNPWRPQVGCLEGSAALAVTGPVRPVGGSEAPSTDDTTTLVTSDRDGADTATRLRVSRFGPEPSRSGVVERQARPAKDRSDAGGRQAVQRPRHRPAGHGGEPSTTVINSVTPSWSEQTASIVASNGGIIYIGDDGSLIANTGAVSSSGVVALDTRESAVRSGQSTGSGSSVQGRSQAPTTAVRSTGDLATGDPVTGDPVTGDLGAGDLDDAPAIQRDPEAPMPDGSVAAVLSGVRSRGGGATSISGLEDHSVNVRGDDQIVTYDDSNVFINRNGRINANTGDTDSSGLNAVDVSASTVRSGNSGDSEDHEDADEEAEDEAPESRARAEQDKAGPVDRAGPVKHAGSGGRADDGTVVTDRARARASVTDEGASTADGDDALVIGADGIDDVSIRSHGNRNVVSYDDSNVVIGGSGTVNAQIGDSDTGGAVVMGIKNSDVRAGCEGDRCRSGAP